MFKKRLIVFLVFFMLFALLAYGATISVGPKIGGGGGGTTIPVQTPEAGKAFNGWNGTSFDTVTMPTPGPTASPVPASTPVAGQAIDGFTQGFGSISRTPVQAPLPTATPAAGKALTSWDGNAFTTMDVVDQTTYNAEIATFGDIVTYNAADFLATSLLNAASGVAPLDSSSKLPLANMNTVDITHGGTGSTTQNFVDLTTDQSVAGTKTFAGILIAPIVSGNQTCPGGGVWQNSASNNAWCYCNGATATCINDLSGSSSISVSGGVVSTISNGDNFVSTGDLVAGTGHPGHLSTNAAGSLCYSDGAATPVAHCVQGDASAISTVAANLLFGSDARGDIPFRGASNYQRLAAGTSGQFLQTKGNTADPVFASPEAMATFGSNGTSMTCSVGGITMYLPLGGNTGITTTCAANAGQCNGSMIATTSGTITKLYAQHINAVPASETFTYTVIVNGSATNVTCQDTAGSAAGCSDIAHTAAFTAGQSIAVRFVCSGATTAEAMFTEVGVGYTIP